LARDFAFVLRAAHHERGDVHAASGRSFDELAAKTETAP
jgi:hypothetical protein